jgi:hypothetical protein
MHELLVGDWVGPSVIPKLFLAVQQARRTAPNTMSIGLLAGSEAVGPWRQAIGVKRVSSVHLP